VLILVLNTGSSSVKFSVVDPRERREELTGIAERLGTPEASLEFRHGERKETRPLPGATHEQALRAVASLLEETGSARSLAGVGHRVVHGGPDLERSTVVTPAVRAEIAACIPLGPLHNPAHLVGIDLAAQLFPGLLQAAVFDTAFHRTMPACASTYPVPLAWRDEHHVHKYGFHGTSHRYVSAEALRRLGRGVQGSALVVAHLGNGCSACAVLSGKSVDTTMGLTPLEGLAMGTRAGSVDPALVTYMAGALGQSAEQIVDALNRHSGLLGLSGTSSDMRAVLAASKAGDRRAALAVEIFCYVLAKAIAALVVPLGRLDALVFTGGIGENSAEIRARVLRLLAFLGLRLDPVSNAAHGKHTSGLISDASDPASPRALVVPTREELQIALDVLALLEGKPFE
jgi:acetate kinase